MMAGQLSVIVRPGAEPFHTAADISAIVTAVLAIIAYAHFGFRALRQRWRLERYLRGEYPGKRGDDDTGARSLVRLMADLGMTEAAVLDAAFRSKKIERVVRPDPDTNIADQIMLRFRHSSATG